MLNNSLACIKDALRNFASLKTDHIFISGSIIQNAFKPKSFHETFATSMQYSLAGAEMPKEKKPLEVLDDLCLEYGLAVVKYMPDENVALIMRRIVYEPYSIYFPRRITISKKGGDSHAK